jgi:hypothetical protein
MAYRRCQVGVTSRRRCHTGALSGGKRQAMISNGWVLGPNAANGTETGPPAISMSFRRRGGGIAHCKYGRKAARPLFRW